MGIQFAFKGMQFCFSKSLLMSESHFEIFSTNVPQNEVQPYFSKTWFWIPIINYLQAVQHLVQFESPHKGL